MTTALRRRPVTKAGRPDGPAPGREPVAVVGAGPYGLSVAAHLTAAGVPNRVFGRAMAGWEDHMPKGMHLKSTLSASSLSSPEPGTTVADYHRSMGLDVPAENDPLPLDRFVAYGRWFQERRVPHLEPGSVTRLTGGGHGFELTLGSGESFRAPAVVVASGHVAFSWVPPELRPFWAAPAWDGAPPTGLVSHPSEHRSFEGWDGREVAVVGGGQSALESAALLHESGAKVRLLVRAPAVHWSSEPPGPIGGLRQRLNPDGLLGEGWSHVVLARWPGTLRALPADTRAWVLRSVLGPFGSWWLRDRVEGAVDILTGTHVRGAIRRDDRLRLDLDGVDGRRTLEVDHVVAATGYRPDLSALPYLDPALAGAVRCVDGWPRLSANLMSSVPNLYLTGLAAAGSFGPSMRFVCGARFSARRIAGSLSRTVRR